MGTGLELLWQRLETNFPLGGARRHLQDGLGVDVVAALEQTGILKQRRLADTYPCSGPRGEGCPRQVIEIDGEYHAVCGKSSLACADIILAAADIAFLAVDPVSLCRGIASALQINAMAEARLSNLMSGLSGLGWSGIRVVPVDVDAVRGFPVFVDFDEDGGGEAEQGIWRVL